MVTKTVMIVPRQRDAGTAGVGDQRRVTWRQLSRTEKPLVYPSAEKSRISCTEIGVG